MIMLRRISLSLLSATLIFASCSDSEDSGTPNSGNPTNVLSAQIDGASFEAINTTITKVTPSVGEEYIALSAYNENDDSFFINIYDMSPGTYELSENGSNSITFFDYTTGFNSVSGSITITEISETSVKATFNAICENGITVETPVAITNGIIDITKTE